jgi:aminodeoxyfutalosine synthase
MTASTFDHLLERVNAGEPLSADAIGQLAASPDILSIGMLADALRRRLHGSRVTYVRVAMCPFDGSFTSAVLPAAREIRITGAPARLADALAALQSAKAVAGERLVSGFSWLDVVRLSAADGAIPARVLADLRAAGLDALAAIPLDGIEDEAEAVEAVRGAGFERLRLTVATAPAPERTSHMLRAALLHERFGSIHAIDPLPAALDLVRPTTGYDDVKAVAIARLAAPNVPTIQVDWQRYGPKLAQVALTFGADDLDNVTASDQAADGRRRAPLEEVRRNIEAAGFQPVERDGRYELLDVKWNSGKVER